MQRTTSLRSVMVADVVMSGAFALLLLLAAGPLGKWLGIEPVVLLGVGAALVLHVAILAWSVSQRRVGAGARYAVVANGAWVLGAAVVLLLGWLDPVAMLALAAVSLAVGAFAVLQGMGLAAVREDPGGRVPADHGSPGSVS